MKNLKHELYIIMAISYSTGETYFNNKHDKGGFLLIWCDHHLKVNPMASKAPRTRQD